MDTMNYLDCGRFPSYDPEHAKHFNSIHAAIIWAEICREWGAAVREKDCVSHEKFGNKLVYISTKWLHDRTFISITKIGVILHQLESEGLIEMFTFGMPARRHIRVKRA